MALSIESQGKYFPENKVGRSFPLYNSVRMDGDLTSYPAADTAAVVTMAAVGAYHYHVICSVTWSYDSSPTGGRLFITAGGNIVFDVDITATGPGAVTWEPAFEAQNNHAVVITLAAAGQGVVGKLNVHAYTEGG